jgi:hypothetical protein
VGTATAKAARLVADLHNGFTVLRRLSLPWDEAVVSADEALKTIAEWYFDNGWTPDDFADACRNAFEAASS